MKPILFLLFFCSINVLSQCEIIDLTEKINCGYRKVNTERNIDIVVVHSTYYVGVDSFSVEGVLSQFRRYGVAAHYLIGRDGSIYRLVDEQNVAFHAGKSCLPTDARRTNLNSCSIGIEIINTPHTAPTEAQYTALQTLLHQIRQTHSIAHLVRHSDIAPERKTDPWMFDWETFCLNLEE